MHVHSDFEWHSETSLPSAVLALVRVHWRLVYCCVYEAIHLPLESDTLPLQRESTQSQLAQDRIAVALGPRIPTEHGGGGSN